MINDVLQTCGAGMLATALMTTPAVAQDPDRPARVLLQTAAGNIEVDTRRAPVTSANILKYVDGGMDVVRKIQGAPAEAQRLTPPLPIITASRSAQTSFVSPRGTRLRLLLDQSNLGGAEVEVGEITFPASSDSGDHVHGTTEIFYVLSGELEHIVNGRSELLGPGMIGFVRPPDKVRHKVGTGGPARALVIWAPGGEAARITATWRKEP